jgi:GT2 family glycosyltransferase
MNQGDSRTTLDISVLIATYNRARQLEATLNDLCRQQTDGFQWEVIAIDNGSTDDTQSVLKRASERLELVTLYEPISGKSRCLNKAFEIARGKLLVFTDDDVHLVPTWLALLFRASQCYIKYSIFCGPVIPDYPPDIPTWLRDHWFSLVAYAHWVPEEPEGPLTRLPCGPNYAVRASALNGLRFDETIGAMKGNPPLGEETKFVLQLLDRGERIVYLPAASVTHAVPRQHTELSWLLTRAFRHGRANARIFAGSGSAQTSGVPINLLYSIPRTLARYLSSLWSDEQTRFERGIRFYICMGELYEFASQSWKRSN